MVFGTHAPGQPLFELRIVAPDGRALRAERALALGPTAAWNWPTPQTSWWCPAGTTWTRRPRPRCRTRYAGPTPAARGRPVLRHLRAGLCRAAGRTPRRRPLDGRRRLLAPVSAGSAGRERPVRRGRPAGHLGRRRRRTRLLPVHRAPGARRPRRQPARARTGDRPHREEARPSSSNSRWPRPPRTRRSTPCSTTCAPTLPPHTVDELAARTAMSRRTFTRHFRKATGMTRSSGWWPNACAARANCWRPPRFRWRRSPTWPDSRPRCRCASTSGSGTG